MNSNKREWWAKFIDEKPIKKNNTIVTKWPSNSWVDYILAALVLPTKVLKRLVNDC